ncbi:PREDICTED: biorientation of chromosomes in cell division protein 1-like 1 [Wasmannia auropunctata]|uniref:biorientation of chromosomes in cell division protein 1-like 1 n=1 Tax=Wasmannia auropunctata TaxID=64793 RepID=UPI0005F0926D|nr:PREDICTED: biorientation of chromosomes in cell division protein 1-like 1 [Wasmannia auropunctata]
MELGLSNTLLTGDPRLIDHIVGEVKSQGIFDQFRKECIADVDTKPAYQNLRTRVEGSVNSFLSKQAWKPDLNKNQLRETLRKHIHDAPYLDAGVERIVDQVVNPKVYSVFMSQIEDVVYKFLGVERPKVKEKNGACGLKDLLPKDLDPVSPESDKNSLKDESLESLDISDLNNVDGKQDEKVDEQRQDEMYRDKTRGGSENGHISLEEKMSDEAYKGLSKNESNLNLNTSAKSDDKLDEEEDEVSPTFEPIDIMNLNESNISNDSHLSGISELTSHRSRSPDFSNELSRDNFEYSNQDSQLSKVSSDSRLSIVTDFGSSNHALTPVQDSSRDDATKDKYEAKGNKDNFKAIRELDSSKSKPAKSSFDFVKSKDAQDYRDTKEQGYKGTKSVSSKENSRDATDSSVKDKYEHKSREKSRDSESTKSSKSTKERAAGKDVKHYKDKSNERKKSSGEKYDKHNSDKYDKHGKSKPKDKIELVKESTDKTKDVPENSKDNSNKLKEKQDEKPKEADKRDKDVVNKEVKDLKDIYKEKIRELREKKELTEKEKQLNKDKDVKLVKETKDKKDPLKDKKSNKKEHRSSSSSSSSKNLSVSYHESKSSKTSEKIADGKDKRSDSKDKAKRDEKRLSKESKGKSHYSSKSDLSDKSDKSDSKKASRSEKEDKGGKVDAKRDVKASGEKTTNGKRDAKGKDLQQGKSSDRAEKSDGRKESKSDSPSKDKKRREDKKSKSKDDHSSLRKNSNDRRSTDRDGSNGSSNKTSPSNSSNSNATSNKSNTSNLTKDSHVSNSGSETSDSIEETQVSDSKLPHQTNCKLSHKVGSQLPTNEKTETDNSSEAYDRQEEEENADPRDINLPLKKRLLSDKDGESSPDVKLKKPKFAKNIHEAKKLMKIRKQMEKQKLKEDREKEDKKVVQEVDQTSQSNTRNVDNLEGVPDDERVQIIEIPDEEYEEPYPEKHEPPLMLDERSINIIMPGTESCANDLLKELISKASSEEAQVVQDSKTDGKHEVQHAEDKEDFKERRKDDSEEDSNNKTPKRTIVDEEKYQGLQAEETRVSQKLEEAAASEKSTSPGCNENRNVKQSTEKNAEVTRDYNQAEARDDNEETNNGNTLEVPDDNKESPDEKHTETCGLSRADATDTQTVCLENKSSSSAISEDNEDCRYFKTDNEKSERFSNFLESLELVENSSLEDIIESLGGKVVSSIPKPMAAPPLPKTRKRSSSPLSDILVNNNSDNNNDGHKQKLSASPNEDAVHTVKKRKYTKKPKLSNLCNSQGISNGENFVMPLSPDSDVSATSDKTASTNVIKEEKSRNRTSHQRYSSDDLYKPRPLFSSSSRRSRRSNQA